MSGKYLLKNVHPIAFPGRDGSVRADILVRDGVVAAVDQATPDAETTVVDYGGAYLSPAWMDMHTHVYWGGCDIGVWPHEIGIATGVPILVEAGSAGEGHFNGLREFIIKPAREQILPFLNVGSVGLVCTNRVLEVRKMKDIDVDRIIQVYEENKDLIVGLKVRHLKVMEDASDLQPLKMAKKLSRLLKLPLMVHVGFALPLLEEVLDYLERGDILTHCYHGKRGGRIIDDEISLEATRRARERGVIFDVGHGAGSYSYTDAAVCIERGILPDTIGTDLHDWSLNSQVFDLSVLMSKMLAVGLPFEKTVDGVTVAPRRALAMPAPALEPGAPADFTMFTVEDSDVELPDYLGEVRRLERRFRPRGVLWRGVLSEAKSRLAWK